MATVDIRRAIFAILPGMNVSPRFTDPAGCRITGSHRATESRAGPIRSGNQLMRVLDYGLILHAYQSIQSSDWTWFSSFSTIGHIPSPNTNMKIPAPACIRFATDVLQAAGLTVD